MSSIVLKLLKAVLGVFIDIKNENKLEDEFSSYDFNIGSFVMISLVIGSIVLNIYLVKELWNTTTTLYTYERQYIVTHRRLDKCILEKEQLPIKEKIRLIKQRCK